MDIKALRELWKEIKGKNTIIEAEVGSNGKKTSGIYYLVDICDLQFCEIPKNMRAKFQENYPRPPFVSLSHRLQNGSCAFERLDIMVGQFFITRVLGKSEPKARTGSEIVEITYLNQFGVEETVVGYLDGKMDKVSLDSPNGIRLFGSRDEMRFQDPFVVYKPTRISEL